MKTPGTLALLLGTTAITALTAMSALAADPEQSEIDHALADWVAAHGSPADAPSAYRYSSTDLNGDTAPEAVVLLTGDYCGSGGCTFLVMRREDQRLKVLSKSTITREPICVAAERSHGWRSLIVRVAGGGITSFDAILRFDGAKYPLNPSMQPHASKSDLQSCHLLDMRDVKD